MTRGRHTGQFALRHLRALWRQPAYVLITLAQPVIWLLLFSQLFGRVAQIPGFGAGSYLTYLVPGLVVMTALMSAGWSGMSFIDDMDGGVMDRLMVSPVWRGSINAGLLVQGSIITLVQSLVLIVIALAMGARFSGGIVGVLAMVAVAMLLGAAFAALSNGFALIARQRESLIGAVTMITLPLTFLSSVFMQPTLLPSWIRNVSRFNPVNWAAEAARAATRANPDWASAGVHAAMLGVVLVACMILATLSFRAYQRSM